MSRLHCLVQSVCCLYKCSGLLRAVALNYRIGTFVLLFILACLSFAVYVLRAWPVNHVGEQSILSVSFIFVCFYVQPALWFYASRKSICGLFQGLVSIEMYMKDTCSEGFSNRKTVMLFVNTYSPA